jgi:Zn-dependent protease/predicted transcriptional regulator
MAEPSSRSRPARRSLSGFDLFSVAGIRITIDYSWFIIFLLVAWSVTGWFRQQIEMAPALTIWSLSITAALFLFVSVLLHELSHSFVARFKGMKVDRITLFIFGGVSHLGQEPENPMDEVQIAVAGPAASFAISAVCAAGLVLTLPLDSAGLSALLLYLALINLALGIFNLVPAFPLDGGRVLRAWLWQQKRSFTRATVSAARVGRILAFGLMGLGVLHVLTGTLIGLWWVLIGLFLSQAASATAERALIRETLSGTPVSRIMSRVVITLKPSESLAEAVESTFLCHHHVAYPVVEDGRVCGVLTLKDIKKHPREVWERLSVGESMVSVEEIEAAGPEEDVVDVLERMLRTGRGRMPVVVDGILAGMVTRRDIMDFLRVQTDLAAED